MKSSITDEILKNLVLAKSEIDKILDKNNNIMNYSEYRCILERYNASPPRRHSSIVGILTILNLWTFFSNSGKIMIIDEKGIKKMAKNKKALFKERVERWGRHVIKDRDRKRVFYKRKLLEQIERNRKNG